MSMKGKLLPKIWAAITGHLLPESDDMVDLGDSTHEFKDVYIDGVARIDDARIDVLGADSVSAGHVFPLTTVTTLTTAGAGTYTAAMLLGGLIIRDPSGGARTDTTHTATQIIAAIPNCKVGTTVEFEVRNNDGGAAETITVAGGADVTDSGTMTVATTEHKRFLLVITNVGTPAATLYSMGVTVW